MSDWEELREHQQQRQSLYQQTKLKWYAPFTEPKEHCERHDGGQIDDHEQTQQRRPGEQHQVVQMPYNTHTHTQQRVDITTLSPGASPGSPKSDQRLYLATGRFGRSSRTPERAAAGSTIVPCQTLSSHSPSLRGRVSQAQAAVHWPTASSGARPTPLRFLAGAIYAVGLSAITWRRCVGRRVYASDMYIKFARRYCSLRYQIEGVTISAQTAVQARGSCMPRALALHSPSVEINAWSQAVHPARRGRSLRISIPAWVHSQRIDMYGSNTRRLVAWMTPLSIYLKL